jgi:rubrerythrin
MIETVDLLTENEMAVARFYRLCAGRFAALRDFWSGLADQEEDHGKWIQMLKTEIKEGGAEYHPEKVNPIAVQSSIKYLNEQSARVEKGELSLVNALSIAVNIERSVFESRVFDAFSGYSQAAKKLLADLKQALLNHNDLVNRIWQEHRYTG